MKEDKKTNIYKHLGDLDYYYFKEGTHLELYKKFGAHKIENLNQKGYFFTVYAPKAKSVSVVGDFNNWDGNVNKMKKHASGIWSLFIPDIKENTPYKFEIKNQSGHILPLKSDPFAFYSEIRPNNASKTYNWDNNYKWESESIASQNKDFYKQPVSIYEVHLGSWKRDPNDPARFLTYYEIAEDLVNYVKYMGFTHIELMPITEHPLDESWGYQPIGMYSPTTRYGNPHDFKYFIDMCHKAGIGVIMDWVPAHFPKDDFGLSYFDGSPLYEYDDPLKGEHPDWGTKIYDYTKPEITNFLIANALFWLKEYRIDGLRVDAVASMLYLDYSRKHGEWVPNEEGGRENKEAIAFLKNLNSVLYKEIQGIMTFAEESTDWPGVSKPVYAGGLGFGYKWNMGWMNDTLRYMEKDPIYRPFHHNLITFGIYYGFSENFILPLSHDEVVHGKKSLLEKMPGDNWQKFANLRAYYAFMWTHPGKKLLFMGGEFAQKKEWDFRSSLDWHQTNDTNHKGVQDLVRDLNILYQNEPALYELDTENSGFEWVVADDYNNSVFAYIRFAKDRSDFLISITNFTPIPRTDYKIGVPKDGFYEEVINTDAKEYNGSGQGNMGKMLANQIPQHQFPYSLKLTIPPLATIIIRKKK